MSFHEVEERILKEDTHSNARSTLGKSITRAAASPDGMYIAAVATPSQIHISRCSSDRTLVLCHVAVVSSRQAQKVLAHADVLRWSPEVYSTSRNSLGESTTELEETLLRAWLLVSDGQRLVVLCVDLGLQHTSEKICTIIADYDLGPNLGRFSLVDFTFSHEYVILLQLAGIQASVISLTRPERQDIANIKYSDSRGLAISPDSKCFSVLTRSEGQDLVVVFTTTEMGSLKWSTFSPLTLDAQGIKWCPDGDPLLCVWDSAAFGIKVLFFTANGHHLRQMDLDSQTLNLPLISTNFEDLGVNTLDWPSCDGKTVIAVFDSSGQLFLQHHSGDQRLYSPMATISHSNIIDGAAYHVWQQSQDDDYSFSRHCASFEPRTVKRSAGADLVAVNADCELVATKDSSRPWTLWIWDLVSPQPLAVVNFRDRIKQILWYPAAPKVLLILTTQKQPLVHMWRGTKQEVLVPGGLIMNSDGETTDLEAKWLGQRPHELPLLFLSSPWSYGVGVIDMDHNGVTFRSLLHQGDLDDG